MKPFYVLTGSFLFILAGTFLFTSKADYAEAGNRAMAFMVLFTALGHFLYTEGMTMMVPPAIPFGRTAVIVTGIIEMMASVALVIDNLRELASQLLIVFFILMLPANIYAAVKI